MSYDGKIHYLTSVLPNVKISLFFMFYNVPLFSAKSAFCNNFIDSLLLIKLTTQQ